MRFPQLNRAAIGSIALVTLYLACGGGGVNPDLAIDQDVGLPSRSEPPDLSSVTQEFRDKGGNAFVRLTGFPTRRAKDVLKQSGLSKPVGYSDVVTFDSLRLASVWGFVERGKTDRLADLPFVTAISPSADRIGH